MDLNDVTVLVLAGGKGTRLAELTVKTPKPLLPVGNKPFISILIHYLRKNGFQKIALSLCYHPENFINSLSEIYPELEFITENEPLGTGGGILYGLQFIKTNWVLILNGDSVLDINYAKFATDYMSQEKASVVIACSEVKQQNRYGFINISNSLVTGFEEKPQDPKDGLINAGIYLIRKNVLRNFAIKACSFETDILPELIRMGVVWGIKYSEKFIDIGTPDDYLHAAQKLNEMKNFKADL